VGKVGRGWDVRGGAGQSAWASDTGEGGNEKDSIYRKNGGGPETNGLYDGQAPRQAGTVGGEREGGVRVQWIC